MSRSKYLAVVAAVAFATVGLTGPALADECADTIAKVEEAAAQAPLADQEKEAIMGMVEAAKAKQTEGDAQGCTSALAEAKVALKIE